MSGESDVGIELRGRSDGRQGHTSQSSPTVGIRFAASALILLLLLALTAPIVTYTDTAIPPVLKAVRQGGYIAVLILAVLALVPRVLGALPSLLPAPLLLALGWAWLSIFWSADIASSVRRLVLLTSVIISIFCIVRTLGKTHVLNILTYVLTLLLAINLAVSYLAPTVGQLSFQQNQAIVFGAWRGVMVDKNEAGLVTGLLILLVATVRGAMPLPVRIGVGIVAAFFMIMTDSQTPMIAVPAAAMAIGLLLLLAEPRDSKTAVADAERTELNLCAATVLGGFVLIGCGILAVYAHPVAKWLFAADALTHRTQIWSILAGYYGDHPILGAGYGGFWNTRENSVVFKYGAGRALDVTQGHNAYFDLLVSLGPIGLFFVLAAFVIWPIQLARKRILRSGGVCAYLMLSYAVICSLTESHLFIRDTVGNVTALLALALVSNLRVPLRRRRRFQRLPRSLLADGAATAEGVG